MIITDDLVMLNFPKTGSSFAREVLKRVYAEGESTFRKLLAKLGLCNPSLIELLLPQIDAEKNSGIKSQHGTRRQIPAAHGDKPILSIARNPLSRYVSLHLFRWWEKHPSAEADIILKKFPQFPNLSFSEYYEMEHEMETRNRLRGIIPRIDLGLQTVQFIQFYFRDPESVLRRIDDDYIERREYRQEIRAVHFLHQENLNIELKEFLLERGFSLQQLRFIDSMEKVNVTAKKQEEADWRGYYLGTPIQNRIIERDKLLFSVFPEYIPVHTCARPE